MSNYLSNDGQVVELLKCGEFTKEQALEAVSYDPSNRFAERTYKQNLPDTRLIEYWVVRVGATSQDKARLAGKENFNADTLARPPFGFKYACGHDDAKHDNITHSLFYSRPTGSTVTASFTPSVGGQYVYVNTYNWKFENEYHGWLTVKQARELYTKMIESGYEKKDLLS